MRNAYIRTSWSVSPQNVNSNLYVDMGGKAGSYRKNVTIYAYNTNKVTTDYSYLCISTSWSFFEKGISSINSLTISMANPTFSSTF